MSKKSIYNNNFLNGEYVEYLPSGEVSVSGKYENGLKVAIWETYREDGSIYSIGKYVNDLQEDDWKYFHRSGNLLSEGNYTNGFKQGNGFIIMKMESQMKSVLIYLDLNMSYGVDFIKMVNLNKKKIIHMVSL